MVIPPFVSAPELRAPPPMPEPPATRPLLLYFRGTVLDGAAGERGAGGSGAVVHGFGVRQWALRTFGRRSDDVVVSREAVSESAHVASIARARFCLAPGGWQLWSAHLSEAVLGGCVPVIVRGDGEPPLALKAAAMRACKAAGGGCPERCAWSSTLTSNPAATGEATAPTGKWLHAARRQLLA